MSGAQPPYMMERSLLLQLRETRSCTDIELMHDDNTIPISEESFNKGEGNGGTDVNIGHNFLEFKDRELVVEHNFVRLRSLLKLGRDKTGMKAGGRFDPFRSITFKSLKRWDAKLIELLTEAVFATKSLVIVGRKESEKQEMFLASLLSVSKIKSSKLEEFAFDSFIPMTLDDSEILWRAIANFQHLKHIYLDISMSNREENVRMLTDFFTALPNLKSMTTGARSYRGLLHDDATLQILLEKMSTKLEFMEIKCNRQLPPTTHPSYTFVIRDARNPIRHVRFENFSKIFGNPSCKMKTLVMDTVWIGMCQDDNADDVATNTTLERLELIRCITDYGPTEFQRYDVNTVVGRIANMFVNLRVLNLANSCIRTLDPIEHLFVGRGATLETLWLKGNLIDNTEFERVMGVLQARDEQCRLEVDRGRYILRNQAYSLRVMNVSNNPLVGEGMYHIAYLQTMRNSERLVSVIINDDDRSNWRGVYPEITSIGCINQFWRGREERKWIGDAGAEVNRGLWPLVLEKCRRMKYMSTLNVKDTNELRVSVPSNDLSIKQDRLSVLYYMMRHVIWPNQFCDTEIVGSVAKRAKIN